MVRTKPLLLAACVLVTAQTVVGSRSLLMNPAKAGSHDSRDAGSHGNAEARIRDSATVGFLNAATPSVAAERDPRALLDTYCIGCHNTRNKTAGLAFDALQPDNVTPDAAQWEKVVRKLRGRMMPPPGRPRPDEATYDAFVARLEDHLDRSAAEHPEPGRVALHRLNRKEYANAVRDLLGLVGSPGTELEFAL